MSPVSYQRTVAAIYADDRLRSDRAVREGVTAFALALAWITHCEPMPDPGGSVGPRLREILGSAQRVRTAIAADLPCYRPPSRVYMWGTACLADMPRRGDKCGANPQWGYRHVHIRTGEWFDAGYCTRHKQVGLAAKDANQAEITAAGRIPEPVPNHGGLLPGLLPEWNWEDTYRQIRSDWVPPMYGIVADRWPLVKRLHKVGKPNLGVIDGAADIADPEDVAPPMLRVVRDVKENTR